MKARLALAGVLLFVVSCADDRKEQVTPTAPSVSKSISAPAAAPAPSTVCLRYSSERALLQAELKDKPTSARLQKRLASVDDLLRDACQ